MHIQHIRVFRCLQGLLRHPEGGQQLGAFRDEGFLTHRGPNITVNNVGVLDVFQIIGDLNESAVGAGLRKHTLHQFFIHLLGQGLRPHGHKVHAHLSRADHPGIAHIVADIAGENHLDLVEGLLAMFFNGHHICQNLRGMVRIRQAVPDGNTCPLGQVFHHLLLIATVFDAVKKAAQYLGGVLQRLLFAHLRAAGIQIGDMSPLLRGRHFKGAAGAGRSLFKQQHDVLALHGGFADAGPALGFQVMSQVQHITNFRGGKILQS